MLDLLTLGETQMLKKHRICHLTELPACTSASHRELPALPLPTQTKVNTFQHPSPPAMLSDLASFWEGSAGPHLAVVPGLSLGPAATGSVVILSLDLSHNAVHVQVPAVVHLDDDQRCLRCGCGELGL